MGKKANGNEEDEEPQPSGRILPSIIKNKQKRSALFSKLKSQKKKDKKKKLKKRKEEEEQALALGEAPPPRKVPKTIESTREDDETFVQENDEELHADDAEDEFSEHFTKERSPKVLITTCKNASKVLYRFVFELLSVIPDAVFYERKDYNVKDIVKFAKNRDFSGVVVLNENNKKPNGLLLINLPDGPTAHFKLSSIVLSKRIKGHGNPTRHKPELILNGFTTRLGHRVGRLFASLFPQDPEFRGRRVVTLHNQRDFIFFRHHRYVFESREVKGEKLEKGGKRSRDSKEVIARLQECGPRFTLKLLSLQRGTFDSKTGEYEWVHKPDMDTSRRRFFL